MFFELFRKAPQHTLHFRDWGLYRPDRNPVEYQRVHNMQWLRVSSMTTTIASFGSAIAKRTTPLYARVCLASGGQMALL